MPCKDILVIVDGPGALEPALALAERFKARVTGLFLVGSAMAPAYGDIAGWIEATNLYMTARRSAAVAAEADFRQGLASHHLGGNWLSPEAEPTAAAVAIARFHDLVVLVQPDPDAPSTGQPVLRPEELVLAAGRPVLVIPYAGKFVEIGRRVLVAWNGSREATRALHDASFATETAEAVTVIEVDAPIPTPGTVAVSAAEVAAFLTQRGATAAAESTASGDVAVPDVLLSRAADLGADLIVMGAYGHSRLREYVLGGVSRDLLRQMTVPVLMAH